jgi:hypothetical protein
MTMPAFHGEIGLVYRHTAKNAKKRNVVSSSSRGCSEKAREETEASPPRKQAKLIGCTMIWVDNNVQEANGWGCGVFAVKKTARSGGKIDVGDSNPLVPYIPKFERYTWTGDVV